MIIYSEESKSTTIEASLCRQLDALRVAQNITQKELSELSGVSVPTLSRMKNGKGISLNTFIRILMALGIVDNLSALLPDPKVRPMEREDGGKERKRARAVKPTAHQPGTWQWGDEIADGDDEY